jgi:hypothetical protein
MTSERRQARAGRLASVAVALLAAGCATPDSVSGEHEYLDEITAATVTVGSPTLVFARERPELAVHARDYLTLVPVDVNRAGTHSQYFYAYVWSTLDKRGLADESTVAWRFDLVADGRRIALTPVAGELRDLGLGEPPLPAPARSAQVLVAPTSREVQAFVAGARELRAVATHGGGAERFELWGR